MPLDLLCWLCVPRHPNNPHPGPSATRESFGCAPQHRQSLQGQSLPCLAWPFKCCASVCVALQSLSIYAPVCVVLQALSSSGRNKHPHEGAEEAAAYAQQH